MIRAVARDVLGQEAAALTVLADDLPAAFGPAVEAILAAPGRVIVAGLGKSGHVGRKIAATLASTGTPADFLHAAEAAHGDMGMIVPGDVALLISRSGETAELAPILYYVTRFDIPLIAISQVPDSTLMRAADHRLVLPDLPEACPIGMAPTTSTTMTLALGDALAMALLDARGFRAEDFRTYHPGGKLGAQLRTAGELMHGGDATPVVGPGANMDDVLLTMTARGFGLAALTDVDGRLTGVVTDGDLRRNMAGLMERRPADIASRDPVTVAPSCLAPEALALMNARKVGAVVVVEDGRPVGVLHLHDLLRAGVA
ncbi:KpsF/GutQ family sugar-phosphate isomerase [Wenxinia marina]|uniref:Arabinose 5-phosphate isomerase n=1 Tax=Wenxinia marina DSM 24838 TaxID=1123501 RepID=A0A0D0NT68_9RHOB|nr:Arabinose 5-phosphate isomerase [Wenxinia marina DSM 24838]